MKGPAGIMALVLAETAAGGVGFLFLTPLWGEVRRGFFYLTGGVVLVLGVATVPLAVGMLFAFARTIDESLALSFFQLLAGAVFTGAVLDGLLLGHWYLTDRRLTRGPINRMAWLLIAAVVLETAAVIVGAITGPDRPGRSASS